MDSMPQINFYRLKTVNYKVNKCQADDESFQKNDIIFLGESPKEHLQWVSVYFSFSTAFSKTFTHSTCSSSGKHEFPLVTLLCIIPELSPMDPLTSGKQCTSLIFHLKESSI